MKEMDESIEAAGNQGGNKEGVGTSNGRENGAAKEEFFEDGHHDRGQQRANHSGEPTSEGRVGIQRPRSGQTGDDGNEPK
jgi:hypothetical protein